MIQFGIPEIYENQARGSLDYLYQDIKYVLKVPIVNFVFRTLAFYEQFLHIAWQQVRPNMLTHNAEQAAAELRYPKMSFKAKAVSWEKYYGKGEIETIRKTIFTFNYVNTKLLLITTAWEESLGYRPISGGKQMEGWVEPGIMKGLPTIKLVHIPLAEPHIQRLLLDIKDKKNGYDVASDYRALAHFPNFLGNTWSNIRNYIGTDEYVLLGSKLREKARGLVHHRFPYSVTMTPDYLSQFYSQKDMVGIMATISMFSNFIANLVIEGELFRESIGSVIGR